VTTDLADLMERATQTMPVETRRLVSGALGRGTAQLRRRRRRTTRLAAGLAGVGLLAVVLVPRVLSTDPDRVAQEAPPSAGTAPLRLLPTDELVGRFAAQLPGTSNPVEVRSSKVAGSVTVRRELTNSEAMTGLVQVDVSVSAPYDLDGIVENKAFCREMHRKVGPRDGSDCLVVPGGIVQFWDDTVAPEDPGDNAPGIRMAYAYFMRWDGGNVNLRTFNSTDAQVAPAPRAVPVIRTDEVVALVQRLDLFSQS